MVLYVSAIRQQCYWQKLETNLKERSKVSISFLVKLRSWCSALSLQTKKKMCLIEQKMLVTIVAIKYSKKICEHHSLLFFQGPNSVYEFMAYRALVLELMSRNLRNR